MYKSKIIFICVFIMSFFTLFNEVFADYQAKVVKTEPCQLYYDLKGKKATGSCIYADTKFSSYVSGPVWVDVGDKVKVITSKSSVKAPTSGYGSECKSEFLYINIDYASKTYSGYVCKDNLWDGVVTDAMKTEFKNAGFPESYYSSLALLKTAHPNWSFVAINTGIKFKDAVDNEDEGNKSLIQWTDNANDVGYLSTGEGNYNWNTDKYTAHDGSTWFAANYDTIAYYLDPRNFLSDNYIFQFELLGYVENEHHLTIVKALLKNQYISKYAEQFVNAGKASKVSPVYLASLSKQEVGGSSATTAITGAEFTYGGKTYSSLYNFYNIGATSGTGAVYRGLIKANGGEDGKDKTYDRPWNTPDKAITGGAKWIYDQYIKYGQNTSYLKKWNVVQDDPKDLYSHQYMQNIQAPYKEAYSTYQAYQSLGMLDSAFTFYIPVYLEMPVSTSLPTKGSPNNYLKTLTINLDGAGAKKVEGFTGDTENYEVHVEGRVNNAVIAATTVNSEAKISGTGTKKLVTGDNKIKITVTAENGSKKVYQLNIIKDTPDGVEYKTIEEIVNNSKINIDDNYVTGLTLTTSISSIKNKINAVETNAKVEVKRSGKEITSGNLVTGDILTITSGKETKSYTIVLYGDTNGDQKINILDLLRVQKNILGTTKLSGANLKAADVSKDGKVNALDLLKVQKHILGDSLISQK